MSVNRYHIYFCIPSFSIRFSKYSIKHSSLTRYNLPTEQDLKLFSAACKFPSINFNHSSKADPPQGVKIAQKSPSQ